MEKTDHVKTAIRWRPLSDDREKAVEKLSENVSIVYYFNSLTCIYTLLIPSFYVDFELQTKSNIYVR